jgi:N-dimethylarginine dimethylaminohydrolase
MQERELQRNVFLVRPQYFEIVGAINPYMKEHIGDVDKNLAMEQWESLLDFFLALKSDGYLDEVGVIEGVEGLPDMVFCANQSYPWMVDGQKHVIMSNMRYDVRQAEVAHIEKYYADLGYTIHHLSKEINLEGAGDMIAHPTLNKIYGGYGYRTDRSAYKHVEEKLKTTVIPLKLVSENFYHLDTCFVPLSPTAVMLTTSAFDEESMDILRKEFETVYEIPEQEALDYFSLNAVVAPEAKRAVIQEGSSVTLDVLKKEGYEVTEIDTGEFIKSGGSCFCMKKFYY